MDDGLRLVFLLMAGVLPLMALRDRVSRRTFSMLAIAYAVIAVAAVGALLARGEASREGPSPAEGLQQV